MPLRLFAQLLRGPEADIDLALASLAVAQIEHPRLVPGDHLRRLDELAARSGAGLFSDPARCLGRLRAFLFEEEGFRGNADAYYDVRNSCLNDVLERKLGIPITLAILVMEVGRRVGLTIDGIGLPGHFVVSAHVGSERVLLDPFHGGTVLNDEEAAEVVARAVGRRIRLTAAHWLPCSKRQVLIRMLRNLKTIYWKQEGWEKALAVVDRLALLDESAPDLARDRGTVLIKLGHLHHGAAEWERYLTTYPHARDATRLREELRRVREGLAALN